MHVIATGRCNLLLRNLLVLSRFFVYIHIILVDLQLLRNEVKQERGEVEPGDRLVGQRSERREIEGLDVYLTLLVESFEIAVPAFF